MTTFDPASGAHPPDFNATAGLAGLDATVDLWRDAWGIPHIRGSSRDDAFAGLGFAHAQDRLWQMEALLQRGTGRFAESVGRSALAGDILARQVDTAGASRRDFALLNAETKAMLEAYARGVNAFIALGKHPVEYEILGTTPAAWEPWHSIAVMRQIGFLMGSVWWKLWRAAALPIVGAEQIAKLRFDDGGDDLLCHPPQAMGGRHLADLAELKPGLEALLAAGHDLAGAELSGGSNNWVLGPQRTATGRPLLAGDPHRRLEMPSMYAQAHIACDEFDAIGLTVPGAPGFPNFGHNGKVAWCVTHAFVDLHDLYIERFDDAVENTRFRDGWKPVTRRAEVIAVKGEPSVAIDVIETHHGPVIAGDPAKGTALALRSAQFALPDTSFDCTLPVLRSSRVEELYEAGREWGLMDHNLVAADISGRIGNRVRAKLPARPRTNGWLPVPGWTGEHEWDGFVPFEDMPCLIDPDAQAIVTANNRVVPNGAHYFSTDSMPPHRTRRIWQRLAKLSKATVEDMAAIHRDTVSIIALEFREHVRDLAVEGAAAVLRDRILAWDGDMAAESTAAVGYVALRTALTRLVAERSGVKAVADSPYAKVAPGIFGETQIWWTVPQLLRANDTGLLKGASWSELLTQALVDAAADGPSGKWAEVHRPTLRHLLSAAYPEHAKLLDKPCAEVGGDNDTVFMSGYIARLGPRAVLSALSRYVFDVGAWDNCRWVVFHGASGDPGSPHYDDQNALWAKGEMVPMLYDWDRIANEASAHQQLRSVASN
ncbi:MAG: penicillin acylase family protein [Bradyrhizobium sp.]|uniref:penicillin acylase family protein n=1 Tax=Bradyrhizobium sp. TaxID=376 RepID=UPI001DE13A84|nr:penicillin acylase family protein [Bradyrhizobium sp.]MBV9560392.1 penicillin acylase family protein [Bradyrhizobium sp.]